MIYYDRIERKLTACLIPIFLEINDDSAKHSGHGNTHKNGETHFRVKVISAVFDGQTRLMRHRMIYQILAAELAERVHALNIEAISAAEHAGMADKTLSP